MASGRPGAQAPELWAEDRALSTAAFDALAIPELAFPLVAFGLVGLACCVAATPSAWLGAAGAGLLVPGALGLVALPVSAEGVLFLVLAAASLWLEVVSTPGWGLHASGGAVALTAAGLSLEGEWSGAHPGVVVPTACLVGATTYLVGRRSPRFHRVDPFARVSVLTGQEAVVLSSSGARGHAVVCGEIWAIRSCGGSRLRAGERVRVTEAGRNWLTVERCAGRTG